ncbi:MAG: hypothetical protein SNJ67_05945 [Chloracidobacterium sp.]|uniref:Uncharacterized protein n=1 Tax=Chloracidobacterium validum TaxID=2821543 RepID=A0ABX8BB74_9BACT|nr:hypothetical protein [Chloracidobacterium validum]QUW04181.1 hypothetical protein J8C06_14150 [Chloracidobacterium validum]
MAKPVARHTTTRHDLVAGSDREWTFSPAQVGKDTSDQVALLDASKGKDVAVKKQHASEPQFFTFNNNGSHFLVSPVRGGNPPALL